MLLMMRDAAFSSSFSSNGADFQILMVFHNRKSRLCPAVTSTCGVPLQFKEDFFALCKLAKDKEVKLIPVLWSFEALDMKSARPGKTQSQANHRYLFEAAAGSPSGQCCDTFVSVLKPLVSE